MLKIGITPAIFHEDPNRISYNGRPLLYLERSMASWLNRNDFLSYILSIPQENFLSYFEKVLCDIDGLILSGGADVDPRNYSEEAMRPEWAGDPLRDEYELALVQMAFERDVPILGICRGHQLLNVAFGGSLYQDTSTQKENSLNHRNAETYEKNEHQVRFEKHAALATLYSSHSGRVNSVHHQSIKDMADGFRVEARSDADGVIESIKWEGKEFIRGVQWHPEFQIESDKELLQVEPLIAEFRDAILERKK